jgi:hypothetical protein
MNRPTRSFLPAPMGRDAPQSQSARASSGDALDALAAALTPLRGLKGGPGVLRGARRSYLKAEYSGDRDRRPEPGLLKRTAV